MASIIETLELAEATIARLDENKSASGTIDVIRSTLLDINLLLQEDLFSKAYEWLCWYDPRYTYYNGEDEYILETEPRRIYCSCDNCFYARDDTALEIIAVREMFVNGSR